MRAKGAMFTVLSAILSGVTPAFAKLIYAEGVNTVTLVFFRNLFAIVPLLLICLWQRCSFRMNGRQAVQLLLSGVFGQTLTLLMLYASYQYIPIATATTLHFMYPIFITLICALVFRERMTWFRLAALGAATLGVGCFVDIDGGSDMGGMSLALLSALTFAYYMVSVEKSGLNRLHPFVITFYFAIVIRRIAAVVCPADLWEDAFVFAVYFGCGTGTAAARHPSAWRGRRGDLVHV